MDIPCIMIGSAPPPQFLHTRISKLDYIHHNFIDWILVWKRMVLCSIPGTKSCLTITQKWPKYIDLKHMIQSLTLVKVGCLPCTFACKGGTSRCQLKHCKPQPGWHLTRMEKPGLAKYGIMSCKTGPGQQVTHIAKWGSAGGWEDLWRAVKLGQADDESYCKTRVGQLTAKFVDACKTGTGRQITHMAKLGSARWLERDRLTDNIHGKPGVAGWLENLLMAVKLGQADNQHILKNWGWLDD